MVTLRLSKKQEAGKLQPGDCLRIRANYVEEGKPDFFFFIALCYFRVYTVILLV